MMKKKKQTKCKLLNRGSLPGQDSFKKPNTKEESDNPISMSDNILNPFMNPKPQSNYLLNSERN